MAMERLFKLMAEKKASDLFIAVGSAVHMKVNGTSIPINQQLMDNGMIKSLLSEIVSVADFESFTVDARAQQGLRRLRASGASACRRSSSAARSRSSSATSRATSRRSTRCTCRRS